MYNTTVFYAIKTKELADCHISR